MSALHVIPPDAMRDSLFRCEWGPWPTCALAYRACLGRQAAMRRAPGRGHRTSPMFPACHDECQVGRDVKARFGAAPVSVQGHGTGKLQVYRPTTAPEADG